MTGHDPDTIGLQAVIGSIRILQIYGRWRGERLSNILELMDLTFLLYAGALLLACASSLGMAGFSWFRLGVPGALSFLFGNLAALAYALGSFFEISSATPGAVLSSLTLQYLGITTIGPLWLLTAQAAAGDSWKRQRLLVPVLFVLPAFLVILVATNDYHHLYYSSLELSKRGPFTVPLLGKGPFYTVNMVYMNLVLFFGFLTAFRGFARSSGRSRQALGFLLGGCLLPWSGMALYQAGLSPWGLDTSPFGFALSGLFHWAALFRYGLFTLSPLVTEQVFENMKEGVLVLDDSGRILGMNPALTANFPELDKKSAGKRFLEMECGDKGCSLLQEALSRGKKDLTLPMEDTKRHFQLDLSPLKDRSGGERGQICMLTDVTEKIDLVDQLALQARTDGLTGLRNRRYFMEQLKSAQDSLVRYGRPYTVAIIDLDYFKAVNDTHGHEAGDLLLVRMGEIWTKHLRPSDVLARYGGEEFGLIIPEAQGEDARPLLERLRSAAEKLRLEWNSRELGVTASFGAAWANSGEPSDFQSLLSQADRALYQAKNQGRNRIVLGPVE